MLQAEGKKTRIYQPKRCFKKMETIVRKIRKLMFSNGAVI